MCVICDLDIVNGLRGSGGSRSPLRRSKRQRPTRRKEEYRDISNISSHYGAESLDFNLNNARAVRSHRVYDVNTGQQSARRPSV